MPIGPEGFSLSGRVAVITGAAVGLGRATALGFAALGADLALCDRQDDELATTLDDVRQLGGTAIGETLDVRDREAVEHFAASTADQFGVVDILVNNAGGGFAAPFLEVNERGEDALVRENFTSVTLLTRVFVPLMPKRGGSIINVTSIEAHRAGPGYAVYSAMKAAVANLTKSLALELGDRRIRVNCIAPDVIPTPGIGPMEEMSTPLARAGTPDDVAAAAAFLASDLSGFVTGTTLHVDGGNHAAGGWHRSSDGSFRALYTAQEGGTNGGAATVP